MTSQRVGFGRNGLRAGVWGVAAATAALALGACGEDDSSSDSAASGQGASSSDCVAKVNELVKKESAPFEPLIPDETFDMAKNQGKSIWYVTPSQATGYGLALSKSGQKAAQAAGMKFTIFDGKGQPDRFTQGLTQAVAQKADGILLYGIDPALVPEGLKRAKAANIPVITMNSGKPAPPDGTVTLAINMDTDAQGRQMVNYAAKITDCKINGAVSFDTTYPGLVNVTNAIKSQVKEICPDTCKVQDHKMKLAEMATALAPSTQSLIQRNPDLNTVFATFDSAAIYEIPAVDRSKADVKIIGTNGNPENLAQVRKGSAQVADIAYVPTQFYGWLGIDQVGRAIQGAKLANEEGKELIMPVQTMDKQTLGTDDSFEATFPRLVGFEDEFRETWGL
jgi:ribose transport system substrate-binding protein